MKLTPEVLKKYVEDHPKLVRVNHSKRYPGLSVLKYRNAAMWDCAWDEILVELRGLVVDQDYNIVSRPFKKMFSRCEPNNGVSPVDFPRDELVSVIRKVNGFMAAATMYQGKLLVSTTGSLDSEYVTLAEKYLNERICLDQLKEGWTYLFEICAKSDPHIIVETEGVHYLGKRNIQTGEYIYDHFEIHNVWCPVRLTCIWSELVKELDSFNHEGFVAYDSSGNALKMKTPFYLTLKKLARMKPERLTKNLNAGTLRTLVSENFAPLVELIEANASEFIGMEEQDRLAFMRSFLDND